MIHLPAVQTGDSSLLV